MTKKAFDNYNKDLFCVGCNHYVPKEHMNHRRVYSDGHITKCNVCFWSERNSDKMSHPNYSYKEIIEFLHCIIYQRCIYLNDIADKLNRSLEDMIELWKFLKIAMKPCYIRTKCENCGKEIEFKPRAYLVSQHHYCSHECYFMDKPNKTLKGKDNPDYNRIDVKCSNCGKSMSIIPYRYKKVNSKGISNNFCSKECQSEYRHLNYSGSNAPCYNRKWTEEEKAKMRMFQLANSVNTKRLNTKPQVMINQILDDLEIKHKREKVFDYYAVDNYLVDYNGIIEIMGDYWHGNPIKYNDDKYMLNDVQANQLHRDKIKYSYINNHYQIPILYIWETDVNNNIDVCRLLIKEYITHNRTLPNYHSFNWKMVNGVLQLNNILITPYQDMKVDEYRHLIKKKTG